MKRILMGTKAANDMTSFLRAWGVFTRPEMRDICEPVRQPEDPRWIQDWTYYRGIDCVYLHRPSNVMDAEIIQRCHDYQIPLWVDLDDDLESITPDNPVYANYAGETAKTVIDLAIKQADVLTVGGESHHKRLMEDKRAKNGVILIPNQVDDDVIDHYGKKPALRKELHYSWRGSVSHMIDLIYYAEVLREEIEKEGQRWRFFGLNPYHLGSWNRSDYIYSWLPPTRDLFDFYRQFSGWNADLQFVGLLESEFNRVKSNLGWSDGTLAGSVVIAPDMPEYLRPGVIHYRTGNLESLREAFYSAKNCDRMSMWSQSMAYINENLRASKVNQIRIEIIKRIGT